MPRHTTRRVRRRVFNSRRRKHKFVRDISLYRMRSVVKRLGARRFISDSKYSDNLDLIRRESITPSSNRTMSGRY